LEIAMKLLAVLALVLVSSTVYAKGAKKSQHRPRGRVTTVDASGSAEPESPWPEIAKKGHL
jgi:hypothetical protein